MSETRRVTREDVQEMINQEKLSPEADRVLSGMIFEAVQNATKSPFTEVVKESRKVAFEPGDCYTYEK